MPSMISSQMIGFSFYLLDSWKHERNIPFESLFVVLCVYNEGFRAQAQSNFMLWIPFLIKLPFFRIIVYWNFYRHILLKVLWTVVRERYFLCLVSSDSCLVVIQASDVSFLDSNFFWCNSTTEFIRMTEADLSHEKRKNYIFSWR